MEQNKDRTMTADIMALLLWFLGGYLCGCLMMNLYWRFSNRTASYAFRISVYDDAVSRISGDDLFWQLLRRDFSMLSLLFPGGLFSWGNVLVCGILCVAGFLLGTLTSGILLTEGVYWWLKGMLWMLPCFLCSGSVIAGEMYNAWKGTYRLQSCQRGMLSHCLRYAGHIVLVMCLTVMVCRAESLVLIFLFSKS